VERESANNAKQDLRIYVALKGSKEKLSALCEKLGVLCG